MTTDRISSLICKCLHYNTHAIYFKLLCQSKKIQEEKASYCSFCKNSGNKPRHQVT